MDSGINNPTQRYALLVLRTLQFLTALWGIAFLLASQYLILHPTLHIISPFSFGNSSVRLRPSSNSTTSSDAFNLPSDQQEISGDPTRFHLNPNWDRNAPPTTRVYNWTVSERWAKPGHFAKRMVVVNGISPGPTIEANFGDTIIVNVVNKLENATAIHWHGQYQNGTNFYDGTVGITQCGIPPNGEMTYNFTVQNVGTYWWHGHFSTQRADGLIGAMVLHSPTEPALTTIPYDGDLVLVLSDMYNTFSEDLRWRYLRYGTGIDGQPGDEPVPDGGSINGISQAACHFRPATNSILPERRRGVARSTDTRRRGDTSRLVYPNKDPKRGPAHQLDQPVIPENNTCVWDLKGDDRIEEKDLHDRFATFDGLKPGGTYRLRLINSGNVAGIYFSIDNHPLTIVEADGVSVEPRTVNEIFVAVAQRYSVIVKLDQKPASYWIRSTLQELMLRYMPPHLNITTFGLLKYEGAPQTPSLLERGMHNSDPLQRRPKRGERDVKQPNLLGDLVPLPKKSAPLADQKIQVSVSMQYTAEGNYLSFFNSTSWGPLQDTTTLFETQSSLSYSTSTPSIPTSSYSDIYQLTISSSTIQTIDLIINNYDDGDHPFHLHGHTFFIMTTGQGRYMRPEVAQKFQISAEPYVTDEDYKQFGLSKPKWENPMRRDTIVVPAFSFAVLRIVTDNPGLWAFHCHIDWHLESGLMMQFANLHGLDKLKIPQELHDMCKPAKRQGS
ncbi:hypothetical protein DL93DRAFT_2088718 [Clavulina sp. PMI_390]|nr:hypothetical protein DL93DRAFT_2088718 [Clavulina sp. PMI_390]